ncbi:MAG TPA: hypothetical protein VHH73_16930 [Verrucomicrobiae bacterium]|nr:hypothetical protein [Verrucomicrobiae bacterium]
MSPYKNPHWWTNDHDASWERVKAAFQRDWDQTKHDFGGNQPDTRQGAGDTVKQAVGKEAIPPRGEVNYEKVEPACRFGHGARSYYGARFQKWTPELERELKRDWRATYPERRWDVDVANIRYGWDYEG